MAKADMTDVHNLGNRAYVSPSGIHVLAQMTTSLPTDEAVSMLKAYPKELVSPDSFRSAGPSASDTERTKEIARLQGVVKDLEGKMEAAASDVAERLKQVENPLGAAFHFVGELVTNDAHKLALQADEGLHAAVHGFHEFLVAHFARKAATPPASDPAPDKK